ncbi:MAG: multi-sensor hybrid histidine kinase [Acidobacteria bacterium]|nr:multi-sensor hybrid histidine kinase [Acidobacteriota bacterium]
MAPIAAPPLRPSARRRGGVTPAGRDLLVVALILVGVDIIAALLLINGYLPSRRREALAKAPAQLALLARDRQNALSGWVGERTADAELSASLIAAAPDDRSVSKLLDRFIGVYGYESAFVVADSGKVLIRRGSAETDDASAVQFALEAMKAPSVKIDFRRVGKAPKVFTACKLTLPRGPGSAAVLFVSNPADYVYPLFSTASVASRTVETNLIGLHNEWGIALNPYAEGAPPPMTVRKRIPNDYAARALASGERSVRYVDRDGVVVIGVVKVIPRTPWLVVAKIDEEEVLAGAVAETSRLGRLLAVVSLITALMAFRGGATLRCRRRQRGGQTFVRLAVSSMDRCRAHQQL